MLLYVALAKPKGWLGIKQIARFRQGHVDALVIGAIFLALDGTAAPYPVASLVLVLSGFYTTISTGALAWWPDWTTHHPAAAWVDFGALSSFALAICAITAFVLLGHP